MEGSYTKLDIFRTAAHIWIDDPSMTPVQAYRRAKEAEELADEIITRLKGKFLEEWGYTLENGYEKEW